MKVLFPKSLCLALGVALLPALAVAQSYLPLPTTSAPVYRPVSLVSQVGAPPVAQAGAADYAAIPSPAASYGHSVAKGGKSCGAGGCGKAGAGYGAGLGLMGSRGGCWYASGKAIYFDRKNDDNVYLSVFDNAIDVGVLDTHDAKMDWTAGGEITVGRYLDCGCAAIELTYWGIDPNQESASVFDPNPIGAAPNLLSAFDFSTLNYDDGVNPAASIDNWFDGARIHVVNRNYRYDNLELNFVRHACTGCYSGFCGSERRYNVNLTCGLRYLDMNEDLIFAADETDTTFDGGLGEVKYCIHLENQMLGFQLGCKSDYYVNDCFAIHTTCKAGIYGNHISHWSYVGGVNGAATVGAGPNAGEAFDVRSSKNDFAMLAEMDLGASYQFGCRWRATAGYRVIAMSGVALPGDQVPTYFSDIDGVRDIGSDGSAVLHGGYAGLEFCY